MRRRALLAALLLGAALIVLILLLREPPLCELHGGTMGTTYTVKYVARRSADTPAASPERLAGEVQACLDGINARMSTYRPDSELSRFNAHAEADPFTVTPETLHVFQMAIEASALTGGAFDITVGPAVNAYGFGPDPRRVEVPGEQELAALRDRIGYHMVHVNAGAGTLRKDRPDIYCDLSAIAKGYAVDQVARLLDEHGITRYMVEVGGEVRVRGLNHEDRPWRIAIEKPVPERRTIHRVVHLLDKALATSGDYRNYYLANGRRISHTIDPRTGRPVTHDLASVTVLDDRCAWADALATGLMVLGPEEGYNLAQDQGIAALFLVREAGDTLAEKATSAFESCCQKDAK